MAGGRRTGREQWGKGCEGDTIVLRALSVTGKQLDAVACVVERMGRGMWCCKRPGGRIARTH